MNSITILSDVSNTRSDLYHTYRKYLFSVAYNIVGEINEAQDILQDTFEDFYHQQTTAIHNVKAYLTRIAANKAIDRLSQLKKQRELYPGTWLPEPVIEPEEGNSEHDRGIMDYSVLSALEKLTPVERAIFVLKEAFSQPYREIAEICDLTEANCRQVLHRARRKISVNYVKPEIPHDDTINLAKAFLDACMDKDLVRLTKMLKKEIVSYSDGGGKAAAAIKPIIGRESISKFFIGLASKEIAQHVTFTLVRINHYPGVVIASPNGIESVITFDSDGKLISKIFVMRNPEKIKIDHRILK